MSKRNSSISSKKFAMVAFKDTMSTNIFPLDQLAGPKMKVAGATVKVYFDGLLQKGTIVTVTDNIHWLVRESENLDVRRYFGFTSSPLKTTTTPPLISPLGHSTPKTRRSSPLSKYQLSPSPKKSRRHSAIGIICPTMDSNKALLRRKSSFHLQKVTKQISAKNERPKAVDNRRKTMAVTTQDATLDPKKPESDKKIETVQKLITDFFQPTEPSVDITSSAMLNLSSFLSSYNYLLQPLTLPLLHEESLTVPETVKIECTTDILPLSNAATTTDTEINTKYDHLTPMELFSKVLWDVEYSRLQDPRQITVSALKDIRLKSNSPELFARNLMYRMFTISDLKSSVSKGGLVGNKIQIIGQLTYDMFPGFYFRWSDCILMMNDSVSYPILLAKCLT